MKDLLGDDVEIIDETTSYLKQMDQETITYRARNLSFIKEIAPEGGFALPQETYHVFTEARDAYVSGLYVATLLLTQSFIEHRLQLYMTEIGQEPKANKGLNAIIQHLLVSKPEYKYILDKINSLRLFRNPFIHLKPFEHIYTIGQVSLSTRKHPNQVLYEKAKESISIMYTVAVMDFR